MPATNYPEFNAAVTELTDRVELLLTDVGKMQSVASVQVAVDKAAEASTSATAASTAATNAGNSATAADASKVAAASSATAADSSKTAAAGSATAAASSATAASSSSTKASQWADAAENTVVETGKYSAKHHAAKAAASATAADGSKTAAAGSASTATTKATEAAASATSAASSNTAAITSKNAAEAARDVATAARDTAVTAASAMTGNLVELGGIDLSGGAYPATPQFATFWKVTVAGVVGGIPYGVGDTLVYSKNINQFYKIDNTESVSSVNGQTGAVTLSKGDLGLGSVDDTSDMDKPVSTAQALSLSGKVDKSGTKVLSDENYTATEKAKLSGISAGAQVNVSTNLSQGTRTATGLPITSSTGTGTTLPVATTTLAGLQSAVDKTKLDGIATGATANAGTVTGVTGTAPIVSTGGAAPAISISAATTAAAGSMSAADKAKLDGIATGATANATDAALRDRATHTGTQAQSTVTNLATDLAAKQATLVSGENIKTINGQPVLGAGDLELATKAEVGDIATALDAINGVAP